MASTYVDSSVVLRMILRQPGALTSWPIDRLVVTSQLTTVECLRSLDRLQLRGVGGASIVTKRAELFRLLHSAETIELTRVVLERAANPLPSPVNTLDALHLVSAQLWREQTDSDCTFATHDAELGRAAAAVGFPVIGL